MKRLFLCVAFVLSSYDLFAGDGADTSPVGDNQELAGIYREDQADRTMAPGREIDWNAVSPRDEAREIRVKELMSSGSLKSGADYFHAAMVLQHAVTPDDYLLAHDLCVIAIGKGEPQAKWLAAASLDRFLVSVGRPQRYGTQFGSKRIHQPMRLAPVDPTVPDSIRAEMNVPPLDEAKKREAKMVEEFEAKKKAPNKTLEPTATSVTPAADAPVAPAAAAAHL
jgi:hypothetical protein